MTRFLATRTFLCAAVLTGALGAAAAQTASPDQNQFAEGKELYRHDCAGCHKWDGSGGGGYGGAALSLRKTQLNRELIIMTISCGRPGTGMPYHLRDAYTPDHPCYGMTSMKDLGQNKPLEADNFLRPSEIAAVADYVIHTIKGKGAPTFAECQAYYGTTSRVCDVYQKSGAKAEAGKNG